MEGLDRETLKANYDRVKEGIPPHVKLIAVSKKRTVAEIQALYDLGHRVFGESYPQELREKQAQLPADIEWHFIGNLQTNKAKYVAPVASLVHTVDGERILDELNKRALAAERQLHVLFQVHIALEETKHGLSEDQLKDMIAAWDPDRWPAIVPRGLMGMATNTDDTVQVRREFEGLKTLFDEQRGRPSMRRYPFDQLSMGMSGDAQLAIQAGSTMVRIGTALFGER